MSIKDYMLKVADERRYRYRIKTIHSLATDEAISKVEAVLDRFLAQDISNPTKTPIQASPPDFDGIHNVEVWIVDIVLGLPVSPPDLRVALADAFGCMPKCFVVRAENEPIEHQYDEAAALADIEAEALKRGLKPAPLLDDPAYSEVEEVDGADLYGAKRNSALLGYLKQVQQDREEAMKVATKSPLFAWAGVKTEPAEDFNADIKDAPKAAEKTGPAPKMANKHEDVVRRAFVDGKGNRVILTRNLKAEG